MTDHPFKIELYYSGIELFNNLEFFDAHDEWEELWQVYSGPDRRFFQGLIQAAVCLYHFGNGNTRGAKKLLHSSTNYLQPFAPHHLGLHVTQLIDDLFACCQDILDSTEAYPDIKMVPSRIPKIVLSGEGQPE